MWPHIRQSLLHTLENIETFHKPFASNSRQLGFLSAAVGVFIGMIVFFIVAFLNGSSDKLEEAGSLTVTTFAEGITCGVHIMVLASAFIAARMLKSGEPAATQFGPGDLQPEGRKFFNPGIVITLILYAAYEFLRLLTYANEESFSYNTIYSIAVHSWVLSVVFNAFEAVTAIMTVLVVMKSAGRKINDSGRPALFAASTILFFWIKLIQVLVSLTTAMVTTPFLALMPNETLAYLFSGGITVLIYVSAMIPCAAIAASAAVTAIDMQFDLETQARQ
ncbi:hypothetical protein [Chitinophaga caseinilytica]